MSQKPNQLIERSNLSSANGSLSWPLPYRLLFFRWVAAVKMEAPTTIITPPSVAVVQQLESPKIIETPFEEYPRHCLYVRDLVLCRTNGEGSYLVDSALTVNTTLADTGAGPSVVTTSLLDTLPGDVCMTRSLDERPTGTILGPDGSPLIARGYAHLTFSLSGTVSGTSSW
jgi:hypothetical protein